MSVEKIMSKTVISVKMDDSLRRVKQLFDDFQFHHLLVIEHGKLRGVISDRDLLRAISPQAGTIAETAKDAATLKKRVHQIMTRKPVTIMSHASIHKAISLFNRYRLSSLPVIDKQHQVVGILSWRDIFRAIEKQKVRSLLKLTGRPSTGLAKKLKPPHKP